MFKQLYKGTINLSRHPVEDFFLIVVLLELFLMGGGRLIEFGSLSLRMVLYLMALGYSVFLLLWRRRIGAETFFLTLSFLSVLSLSAFIGSVNNADVSLLIGDVKQLSFFLIGVFFWFTINSIERVNLTIKLIKFSSLFLSTVYLLLLLMILVGIINFTTFYSILNATGEVYFRGESGFFYKGFLYMCIGLIFYLFDGRKRSKAIALLIFAAIVLTFTRGFLLAMVLTFFLYLLVLSRRSIKTVLYLFIFCAGGALLIRQFLSLHSNILGSSSASDMIRVITAREVWDALNPLTVFIGHGFGIGVPEKLVHMEVAYLEIFHKQGIIGLTFWFVIFLALIRGYVNAVSRGNRNTALPFFLSCLFIYLETMTNPFLNNPIGMSMILISVAVFNVLGKKRQRPFHEDGAVYPSGRLSGRLLTGNDI